MHSLFVLLGQPMQYNIIKLCVKNNRKLKWDIVDGIIKFQLHDVISICIALKRTLSD